MEPAPKPKPNRDSTIKLAESLPSDIFNDKYVPCEVEVAVESLDPSLMCISCEVEVIEHHDALPPEPVPLPTIQLGKGNPHDYSHYAVLYAGRGCADLYNPFLSVSNMPAARSGYDVFDETLLVGILSGPEAQLKAYNPYGMSNHPADRARHKSTKGRASACVKLDVPWRMHGCIGEGRGADAVRLYKDSRWQEGTRMALYDNMECIGEPHTW